VQVRTTTTEIPRASTTVMLVERSFMLSGTELEEAWHTAVLRVND
jgi:hypothetical protein